MGHVKLWESMLDCPKLHQLSDRAFRCWVKLLCNALRNGGRNGELPTLRLLVFRMRMSEQEILTSLEEMHQCYLLEPCPDNPIGGMPWKIHDYEHWQAPKDPRAALRQANWREKQALRNALHNGVTNGNVTDEITATRIEGLKEEVIPPNPRKRGKAAMPPVEEFQEPSWLPEPEWSNFKEMRRSHPRVKCPATMRAVIRELEKLKEAGEDIRSVLARSTMTGSAGVFAVPDWAKPQGHLKNGKPTEGNPPSHQPAPTITPAQQAHADQMMADGYRKIEQARLKRLEEKAAQ